MSTRPEAEAKDVLGRAIAHLGASSGTVHLRPSAEKVLHLAAWEGAMPEVVLGAIRVIPFGKGMAGLAAERVEAVETCNLQTSTSTDIRPGAKKTGVQGALVVPALLGDEVIGTVGVACASERAFSLAEAEGLFELGRALARRLAAPPAEALWAILAKRLSPGALDWLTSAQRAASSGEREALSKAFTAAARQLGRDLLNEPGALVTPGREAEVPLRGWRVDDAGRAAMLLSYSGDGEGLARELYFSGDMREKCSALRILALAGRGSAAVDAVLDACRSSATELFEAAIGDNPYASRVLPEHEFRQAVLKAVFVGVPLNRVQDISRRADPELSRMLLSYASEREAAGRSIPAELWSVAAIHPPSGLAARLIGLLEHASEAHRLAAVQALARMNDARARAFLEERAPRETAPVVRRALDRALS